MNRWIFAAGVLSVVTFFIHLIAGEPGFHIPALQSDLLPVHKSILSVIWHCTSGMLALNALALLWAAKQVNQQKPLVLLVAAQYIFLATCFVFYGLVRHGSLVLLPQWTILFVIPILALAGLKPQNTDLKGDIK